MTKVEEIEKAVAALPAEALARFRVWFDEFDAAEFDRRIQRDAKAGKLDRLADAALSDHAAARSRTL